MDIPVPERKRLVYGRQATLEKHIARHLAKGWRLRMTRTDYWVNGKRVYIADLDKVRK